MTLASGCTSSSENSEVTHGKSCLVLVPTKPSRDGPLFTVTFEQIPRGTRTAGYEHHGLGRARIYGRGQINHISPSFDQGTSWHLPDLRRDNLNPHRQLLRNRHRDTVSSIHGAGKT
jgi:hypothetical protein